MSKEIVIDLPDRWAETNIGCIATINPPGATSAADDDDIVTFLPMAAVEELSGKVDMSDERPFSAVKKGFTRFRDGDLLVAKITPSMENGKVAVARGLSGGLGCGSTEFHVIRAENGVEPDYLRYYVVRSAFRREAKRNMQGAVGQQRVPPDYIRNSPVPLAPSNEQKQIVSKIDELFSSVEDGERALERVRKLVDRYRQSVLKAAVTGELTHAWRDKHTDEVESGEALLAGILGARRKAWEKSELDKMKAKGVHPSTGDWKKKYQEPVGPDISDLPEIPTGWVWSSLGQLFAVGGGSTPSRKESSYWGGNIPWVSSGEVAFCRIKETRETISEAGYQNSSVKLHPKGTVLLAMIGEGKTRGQAAILDLPACHNQNAASIGVSATPIPPEYVYHFLKFQYEKTRATGQGGNQPALNGEIVKRMAIPLPPLKEIVAICEIVDIQMDSMSVIESSLRSQHSLIEAQRQTILREAFRGRLVSQCSTGELASVLLERIAAERGASSNRVVKKFALKKKVKA